ncbi:ArsR family transcriptional regulator [Candidatus Halobonum tyrrellensis G22]|uniref:ArsR family transcriptional regulator n=1 Tax=Candidatus Halobonum tyrrellensis G22 TaxID=1324957 RepID=V4J1U3_9EURY|nr:ArsR family transcriptional regulator [Candidatus Halobonum tyrrellensis G22]
MNTNQLAEELDLNYKTVQHHLEVLEESAVLTTQGDDYGKMYFLTDRMTRNLDVLDEVADQADIDLSDSGDTSRYVNAPRSPRRRSSPARRSSSASPPPRSNCSRSRRADHRRNCWCSSSGSNCSSRRSPSSCWWR